MTSKPPGLRKIATARFSLAPLVPRPPHWRLDRLDVSYSPQVTWGGYRRIRDFCQRVRDELAELEPRDFIDVQFFMFVTSQHDG